MIWGFSLHGWEDVMRASLAIAGVFGLIVGLSTWFVVKLQREEIAASLQEFDAYKLKTSKQITEANTAGETAKADAAKANETAEAERLERLKLEEILGPRALSLGRQRAIANFLAAFLGKKVSVISYAMDGEGASLAMQIIAALEGATIVVDKNLASIMPLGGFSSGVHVTGKNTELVASLRQALTGIGRLIVAPAAQSTSPLGPPKTDENAPDAAILVGIKPVPIMK